jgi:hypothetical protein
MTSLKSPPNPPEAVKKFRQTEIGGVWGCPGKGKFPAVKTRREILGREALPGLPQSDVGNLQRLLSIQTKDLWGFRRFHTERATEKSAPVLAAGNFPFPGKRKRPLPPSIQFFHTFPLQKGGGIWDLFGGIRCFISNVYSASFITPFCLSPSIFSAG